MTVSVTKQAIRTEITEPCEVLIFGRWVRVPSAVLVTYPHAPSATLYAGDFPLYIDTHNVSACLRPVGTRSALDVLAGATVAPMFREV